MITQSYKLNLIPNGQILVVPVSQYDIGRTIQFELYNGSSRFNVPQNTTASIDGTKPDKKGFSLTASLGTYTATFDTTRNMCAVPGNTICEFRLMKNSLNIGTANFILKVERAGLADDIDISETEIPAYIDGAQAAARSAAASAEAAADSATSASGSATSAGNSATSASGSATSASSSATTATKKAQDAEAYAIGKRNGTDVPSTDPAYHNNSKYYAEYAEDMIQGGIPDGTSVAFRLADNHIYVQQTIDGVAQPEQDLGVVGGTVETEETWTNIASKVSVANSLPFSVSSAYLHRRGRQSVIDLALTATGTYSYTGFAGIVDITDIDGKLMPFWLNTQHASNNLYCGYGMFSGTSGKLNVYAYTYMASATTMSVLIVSDGTLSMSANESLNLSLSFINKYSE